MDALASAARAAPQAPGVYFMLGATRELLYIGKAGNLRRRLQQHAKGAAVGATPRDVRRGAEVVDVRWEVAASEDAALDREADLVVALAPRLNGAMATDGRWTFVDIDVDVGDGGDAGAVVALTQTRDAASAPAGRRFGCFPHLGPGGASRRGDRCTAGLAALLRLIWAAAVDHERDRPPAMITGASVPLGRVMVPAPPDVRGGLTRFFTGASSALVARAHAAALANRPAVEHARLAKDAEAALGLFEHGPRALRALRTSAGLPQRPLLPDDVRAVLARQVEAVIGPFHVPPPLDRDARLVGARTSRALAAWSRRQA